MNRKYKELIETIPYAKYSDVELMEVKKGYAKGRIKIEEKHCNPYKGVHGGCIFTLADTIAGIAAATCGNYCTTIDSNIHYLLPVCNTEYMYCIARVVRQGAIIGVYNVEILDDCDNICVTATMTYYRLEQEIELIQD